VAYGAQLPKLHRIDEGRARARVKGADIIDSSRTTVRR
jgi:hypothetical protein